MSAAQQQPTAVGVIGLGIMGGAMARNLVANGFAVTGYDTQAEAGERLRAAGGRVADSLAGVLAAADVVFTSLPTVAAFESVVAELAALAPQYQGKSKTVIEVSTLPLVVKHRAHDTLQAAGCTLLDCPVSGTGAQAAKQDLVVFGSGDEAAWQAVDAIVAGMSRRRLHLGKFGNGTTMKFLANHLVAIHNAAAGEAFALARRAGVDLGTVFETLQDSAATSRMYQMRGPLMVEGRYDEPTARIEMFMKDLDVIGEFAAGLRCPTPLFNMATQMYYAAHSAGLSQQDTAAVTTVFDRLAGVAP